MQVNIKSADQAQIVEVSGKVDGSSAAQLQEQLKPVVAANTHLVLDMSRVIFLASAGLRVLLSARRQLPTSFKLILVGLNEHIMETMTMTGFIDFFACSDTLEAGLADIAAS